MSVFDNCGSLDKQLKIKPFFWHWVKWFIMDGSLSILGFVDWLGSLSGVFSVNVIKGNYKEEEGGRDGPQVL